MKHFLIIMTILSSTCASASNPFQSPMITPKLLIHKPMQIHIPHNSKFFFAQRAANIGNVQAKFDLAMMYALGKGVQKDPRKAFKLFHEAARKGHVEAKYCMGVNFEKGLGVRVQKELASYWFKLAAKSGHSHAAIRLALIKRRPNVTRRQLFASL